ncbi:MAG: hypothetical protein AAFQ53_16605, partial [Bacteroidota bacterium]
RARGCSEATVLVVERSIMRAVEGQDIYALPWVGGILVRTVAQANVTPTMQRVWVDGQPLDMPRFTAPVASVRAYLDLYDGAAVSLMHMSILQAGRIAELYPVFGPATSESLAALSGVVSGILLALQEADAAGGVELMPYALPLMVGGSGIGRTDAEISPSLPGSAVSTALSVVAQIDELQQAAQRALGRPIDGSTFPQPGRFSVASDSEIKRWVGERENEIKAGTASPASSGSNDSGGKPDIPNPFVTGSASNELASLGGAALMLGLVGYAVWTIGGFGEE